MQPLDAFQGRLVSEARRAYRGGAREILIQLPTGGGKTRVGVEFVAAAINRPGAAGALWLAHREELLKQARDRLIAEGIPRVGIIAPWAPLDLAAETQVASVQTLAAMRRKGKALPRAKVAILDECHHYVSDEWGEIAQSLSVEILLGLTATPERGDGRPMGKKSGGLFEALVVGPSVRELQETVRESTGAPILVQCITYAPEIQTKDLAMSPVDAYVSKTPGERAFVFCAGVDHAEFEAAAFREAGIPAATIHVNTPWPLRRARIEAFRVQNIRPLREAGSVEDAPLVLVSCFALTEGVDVPEAAHCIMARKVGSASMQIQATGRVLRSAPGKDRAVFSDLCGNVWRHGLPEADRTYSLDGQAIRESAAEKADRICACRCCGAVFGAWRVSPGGRRTCPVCRESAPAPKPVRVSPRELIAMGHVVPEDQKLRALAMMARVAVANGHKPGAIWHRYRGRFGEDPSRDAVASAVREAQREARGEVA